MFAKRNAHKVSRSESYVKNGTKNWQKFSHNLHYFELPENSYTTPKTVIGCTFIFQSHFNSEKIHFLVLSFSI